MGIEPEKIDEIITMHTETVNALKEERDTYKPDAEKLPKVQKELDELKEAVKQAGGKENPFEKQYNDLKAEYDKYKADVSAKEKERNDRADYRKILIKAGVPEDKADTALRLADLSKIKRDKEGKIENEEELVNGSKEEWKAIIPTVTTQGAQTPTPPANNGGTPGNLGNSRAAELAKKYHESLYGKAKE